MIIEFRAKIQKQRGYATVMGAILTVAMMLSIFSLYDIGQVSSNKIKIQNAIDAGVYSTSNYVARDMNFIAYTNRAMVANQVAIAQMVGLSSYVHMLEQSTDNVDKIGQILKAIPYAGVVIATFTKALDKAADVLKKVIDSTAKVVIPFNDAIIEALSIAQTTFHGALMISAPLVFDDVVKANDEDVEQPLLLGAAAVEKYIREYRRALERNTQPRKNPKTKNEKLHLKRYEEFHKVTHDSRDRFSSNRYNSWIDFSILGYGLKVKKYGASDLNPKIIDNKYVWEWTAMDTVGLNLSVPLIDAIIGGEKDLPIGWGSAHATNKRSSEKYDYAKFNGIKSTCFWPNRSRWAGAWRNRNAACLENTTNAKNRLAKIGGLRPFYDLRSDGLIQRGPSFVATVKKKANKTRVWKEVAKGIPQYQLQANFDVAEKGGLARDQMLTIAKSEVYFSRAPDLRTWARSNSREIEFGNMYNPFWQARLIETTTAERVGLVTLASGINL